MNDTSENWTDNDPRMWRWVSDGLQNMYRLLQENKRFRKALQRIAITHPVNEEPLAKEQSLNAHKALNPNCECSRCNTAIAAKNCVRCGVPAAFPSAVSEPYTCITCQEVNPYNYDHKP